MGGTKLGYTDLNTPGGEGGVFFLHVSRPEYHFAIGCPFCASFSPLCLFFFLPLLLWPSCFDGIVILTMTKTVFTPPWRIVGVTNSIIGPSRKWTVASQLDPALFSFLSSDPLRLGRGERYKSKREKQSPTHTMKVRRGRQLDSLELRKRHCVTSEPRLLF